MQLINFAQATGQEIALFDSAGFVLSRLARLSAQAVVSVVHLLPDGVIGRHQAIGDQLFLVVWGAGSVSGAAGEELPISAGQGVLWGDGEWHETRTVGGLTAVIIEAPTINLAE